MNSLDNLLKKLNLNENNGLIYKKNMGKIKFNNGINSSLKILDFDAVYINNSNSIFVFKEYLDINKFNNEFEEFYRDFWNLNEKSILFLILPHEIRLYNLNIFNGTLDTLNIFKNEEEINFTDFNIDNINSVSTINKYELNSTKTFTFEKYLLKNIEETVNTIKNLGLPIQTIHNIFIRLIFSRYLVDNEILDNNFFKNKYNENFNELIKNKEKLYDFFKYMETNYSPDLFTISETEYNNINNAHLNIFYNFFKGTIISTKENTISNPYNFRIIPVELISNIYAKFLSANQNNKQSYYTPKFIVDYILDLKFEEFENKKDIKILDPCCGSGIFLVESLKRILCTYETITEEVITKILNNNLYGIDINKNAINLTVMSLHITILEFLDKNTLKNFKMPKLKNRTLFNNDFFDENAEFNKLKDFNLIIGTPPHGKVENGLHINYYEKNNIPVSDNQISQSFLFRIKDFSNNKTNIAMTINSSILYENKSKMFRKVFASTFKITEITELALVKKELFKTNICACSILFYDDGEIGKNKIKHTTLKTNSIQNLNYQPIINKNDIIYVVQDNLIKNDWIWKILVFGNTSDFEIINRLKKFKTLKDISEKYKIELNTGVNINKGSDCDSEIYKDYNYLNTETLQKYKLNMEKITKWNGENVDWVKDLRIFTPPYILINNKITDNYELKATFSNEQWIYNNDISSIKSNNEKLLKCILGFINSKFFIYYAFLTFQNIGITNNYIALEDLISIPIVYDEKIVEIVDKIINLSLENKKYDEYVEELDNRIFEVLKFRQSEIDTVNYLFNVTIPQLLYKFDKINRNVTDKELNDYVMLFYNNFKYYFDKNDNGYLQIEIFKTTDFIAIKFNILEHEVDDIVIYNNNNKNIDKLGFLSIEDKNNLRIQRDILGFGEDYFYIVKTNEYKNWHKSIAKLDIIEFTNEILNM